MIACFAFYLTLLNLTRNGVVLIRKRLEKGLNCVRFSTQQGALSNITCYVCKRNTLSLAFTRASSAVKTRQNGPFSTQKRAFLPFEQEVEKPILNILKQLRNIAKFSLPLPQVQAFQFHALLKGYEKFKV